MFFTQLASLLSGPGRASRLNVMLSQTQDGSQLNVVVVPHYDEKSVPKEALPSVQRPLMLVATPKELDEQFAEAFGRYATARSTLNEQIEAEITLLRSDTEASATRASKALSTPSKAATKSAAKPVLSTAETDNESPEDDDAGPQSAPAPATVNAAGKADDGGLNLFG